MAICQVLTQIRTESEWLRRPTTAFTTSAAYTMWRGNVQQRRPRRSDFSSGSRIGTPGGGLGLAHSGLAQFGKGERHRRDITERHNCCGESLFRTTSRTVGRHVVCIGRAVGGGEGQGGDDTDRGHTLQPGRFGAGGDVSFNCVASSGSKRSSNVSRTWSFQVNN